MSEEGIKITTWFLIKRYILNVLIAIDQLFNAILLGDPDETISSRLSKWLNLSRSSWRWKISYVICRFLHLLDKDHCEESTEETGDHDLINMLKNRRRLFL